MHVELSALVLRGTLELLGRAAVMRRWRSGRRRVLLRVRVTAGDGGRRLVPDMHASP